MNIVQLPTSIRGDDCKKRTLKDRCKNRSGLCILPGGEGSFHYLSPAHRGAAYPQDGADQYRPRI